MNKNRGILKLICLFCLAVGAAFLLGAAPLTLDVVHPPFFHAPSDELMQTASPEVVPVVSRPVRQMWMEVTAYCPCTKCCGPHANGITASGQPVTVNLGRFVAADTRVLPFGSTVRIPGYHDGQPVPVLDRGGAIKGDHLDVFFPSHQQALDWGRRWVLVEVE